MLLNTDWYIDQMARKAYEGEPIPITMVKDQYRQGTRDFVHVYPNNKLDQNVHYNMRDIISYVIDDNKKVLLPNKQKVNVVPVKKFKIKVDKQKVLANGTVRPDQANQIVDEIQWSINSSYIMKNQLAVWDMLAHFNWDRPIYFSITMGKDSFYGLSEYFQQEGFAYRFVPIKTPNSGYRDFGMVDTEKMYDRLINQFSWGGYENDALWMDENNQRFITNIRFTFVRLAEALIKEGKMEKAETVLDRLVEVAVHDNFSYNGSIMPIAESYLRMGKNEKGVEILRKMVENESQYLDYYLDQTPADFRSLGQKTKQSIGLIGQSALMVSQNFPQSEEIQKEFNDNYQVYAEIYQGMGN